MRFEPYSPDLGCLAMPASDGRLWLVVCPGGRVLAKTTDEYEARNEAMYRNLTATKAERDEWNNR